MCLGNKLSDRSLQRYKAKGKKCGYIRVWKYVYDTGKKFIPYYFPEVNRRLYRAGLGKSRQNATCEQHLIHAFRNEKSALKDGGSASTIVQAIIQPDWAKAVGKTYTGFLTLTTKAIVMPEYPKRKVTVREFRAAIKGKKVKTYSWE